MDAKLLFRRYTFGVPLAACGAGVVLGFAPCPAFAQKPEPAARMLPARPVDEPPAVRRAATPEYASPGGYAYQVPASIPAPNYAGRPTRPTQPTTGQPEKPGVVSGAVNGLKDLFRNKPSEQPVENEKPWWPTSGAAPGVRPVQATTPEPSGVYAGPPAYRWFGYGSPTPGANQFAPGGLYPKGSANWYSQTGATPGAFPVPVTANTRTPGIEPPSYGGTFPADGTYLPGTRIAVSDSQPARQQAGSGNRAMAQPYPPRSGGEPQMPHGGGTLITSTSPPYDPSGAADPSWQPVNGRYQQPIVTTPPAGTAPPKLAPAEADQPWLPSHRSVPAGTTRPAPSVSMIRGQAPEDERPDLPVLIRSVCFGRTSDVTTTAVGVNKLHVKLTAPTESDARDAATLVSRLPELKPYTVTFEATIRR